MATVATRSDEMGVVELCESLNRRFPRLRFFVHPDQPDRVAFAVSAYISAEAKASELQLGGVAEMVVAGRLRDAFDEALVYFPDQ